MFYKAALMLTLCVMLWFNARSLLFKNTGGYSGQLAESD